jgi:hypothetical protein
MTSLKIKKNMTKKNKTLKAENKYASVNLNINKNVLKYKAKLKNTKNVSAVHIHQNKNGKPGPILSWIATTPQWNSGVLQNKKNMNKPCCSKEKKCNLTAPLGTRKVKSNSLIKSSSKNPKNKNCNGAKPGAILVIHGKKFQFMKKNKTLSKGKPGLNIIKTTNFN